MASNMLGYMAPTEIDESKSQAVKDLNNDHIWKLCTESIKKSLSLFTNYGVELKVDEYKYTILLPNPDSIYTKLSERCCGDGEIPNKDEDAKSSILKKIVFGIVFGLITVVLAIIVNKIF